MRFSVILHYSSLLIIGIGSAMLLPLGFSLYYEDSDVDPFLISIGITLTAGILLRQFTIGARGPSINRREALALVVLSWILVSLFGALPFQFEGTFSSYLDSFFEATSGFTTTGASVLADIESQPHGILLWRDFIQWLGGLGIVALFVSLFPLVGIGAAYLFEAEGAGPETQKLKVRIKDTAQVIWIIYAGISTLEVILLMAVGKLPFFDSLCHTFGTMATGGFSTRNASIGAYDSLPVNLIIICFMVIAGVNFALYYNLFWHRSLRTFFANTELRVYLLPRKLPDLRQSCRGGRLHDDINANNHRVLHFGFRIMARVFSGNPAVLDDYRGVSRIYQRCYKDRTPHCAGQIRLSASGSLCLS